MLKIYFPKKVVIIKNENPIDLDDSDSIVFGNWNKELIRNFNEILEGITESEIYIIHNDIEEVLDSFKKEFSVIQAAGGAVINPGSEVLLIFRRGKWDLPKGKLDEGETLEICAVREVEEETGLNHVIMENQLATTYHIYSEKGVEILKETYWYKMAIQQKQELIPQVEEDIQECRWVPIEQLSSYEENMQPSVKDVISLLK